MAIGLILLGIQVFGQVNTEASKRPVELSEIEEVQDESWSYLGERLYYQLKKRMLRRRRKARRPSG